MQVALGKHGLEVLESGRYWTKGETQTFGVLWNNGGCPSSALGFNLCDSFRSHVSDVLGVTGPDGAGPLWEAGVGNREAPDIMSYTGVQGLSREEWSKPRIPSTWGIFFHDPGGVVEGWRLATLEVKSLPCFPPIAISGDGSVYR